MNDFPGAHNKNIITVRMAPTNHFNGDEATFDGEFQGSDFNATPPRGGPPVDTPPPSLHPLSDLSPGDEGPPPPPLRRKGRKGHAYSKKALTIMNEVLKAGEIKPKQRYQLQVYLKDKKVVDKVHDVLENINGRNGYASVEDENALIDALNEYEEEETRKLKEKSEEEEKNELLESRAWCRYVLGALLAYTFSFFSFFSLSSGSWSVFSKKIATNYFQSMNFGNYL